jgi:hypothetical protein
MAETKITPLITLPDAGDGRHMQTPCTGYRGGRVVFVSVVNEPTSTTRGFAPSMRSVGIQTDYYYGVDQNYGSGALHSQRA